MRNGAALVQRLTDAYCARRPLCFKMRARDGLVAKARPVPSPQTHPSTSLSLPLPASLPLPPSPYRHCPVLPLCAAERGQTAAAGPPLLSIEVGTDPPSPHVGGWYTPNPCPPLSSVASCHFMLTCALLMTSSHSKGTTKGLNLAPWLLKLKLKLV